MSYEGSNNEEELKMVSEVNQNNNNCNVVSYPENEIDEKSEENLFDKDIDEEVK